MKIQCCSCGHIIANQEWDGMLDCELTPEEIGGRKCCYLKGKEAFRDFVLEKDIKIVESYLKAYVQQRAITKSVMPEADLNILFKGL